MSIFSKIKAWYDKHFAGKFGGLKLVLKLVLPTLTTMVEAADPAAAPFIKQAVTDYSTVESMIEEYEAGKTSGANAEAAIKDAAEVATKNLSTVLTEAHITNKAHEQTITAVLTQVDNVLASL